MSVWCFNTKTLAFSQWSEPATEIGSIGSTVFSFSPTATRVMLGGQFADAYASTGLYDFGVPELKNVRAAYVGARVENPVQVEVVADDKAYTYSALASAVNMPAETRVLFGRGLMARYWAFKLSTTGRASIKEFRLLPHVKERRI